MQYFLMYSSGNMAESKILHGVLSTTNTLVLFVRIYCEK